MSEQLRGWQVNMKDREYLKWDEYMVHQAADTIDRCATAEGDFFEHYAMFVLPEDKGEPYVLAMVSVHPAAGYMHAGAITNVGSVQYNIRACREVSHDNDRAETVVHPLYFKIIEPLRRWRISLAENAHVPVTFDVEFEGRATPQLWPRYDYEDDEVAYVSQWCHMVQPGRVTQGNIAVEGKVYDVKGYSGVRDRCWGIRSWKGGVYLHVWVYAVFNDYTLHLWHRDGPNGEEWYSYGQILRDSGDKTIIVKQELVDFSFEKGTRNLTNAKWILTDDKGKVRTMEIGKRMGITYYGGIWTGEGPRDYKGPYRVEGDRWVVDEQMALALGPQLRDMHCEFLLDGDVGHGVLEYAVSKRHVKYGTLV